MEVDVGDNFLDAVTSEEQKAWTTKLLVGTQEFTFKLDTGAGVTAVSEEVYRSLNPTTPLLKPTKFCMDLIASNCKSSDSSLRLSLMTRRRLNNRYS